MKYLSIIEKFFWCNLDENEVETFNRNLKNNPKFKEEFDKYKYLVEYLKRFGENDSTEHSNPLNDIEIDEDIYDTINKYSSNKPLTEEELDLLNKIKQIKSNREKHNSEDPLMED